MARKALGADQWSEDAYGLLVCAAVGKGDRSGAHRLLDRCIADLAEIGVEPSPTTNQLCRRVQAPSLSPDRCQRSPRAMARR
jgi:DNA-binding SARP family transcriptional activator